MTDFDFEAAANEVAGFGYETGRKVALVSIERLPPWGLKFPSTLPYFASIDESVVSAGYATRHTGRGKTPWEAYREAFGKMHDYVPHITEPAEKKEKKKLSPPAASDAGLFGTFVGASDL